jgi:hypothetical protein
MESRGFKRPRPLKALLTYPIGDVVAVRAFAHAMLEGQNQTGPALRDARLVMTAACLLLQSRTSCAPNVEDLLELLYGFASAVEVEAVLGSSPMQFLQFAAAEFVSLAGC